MYLHFFWNYGKVKKDDIKDGSLSELQVDVDEDKGGQTEGKAAQYRLGCIVLSVICFSLLLAVIVLSLEVYSGRGEAAAPGKNTCSLEQPEAPGSTPCVCPDVEAEDRVTPPATTCSLEQCEEHLSKVQPRHYGCMQCAGGWLTLDRSCFYLSTTRLDWAQSQGHCAKRGASLAVITTQKVQDFLTRKGYLTYWIGLRRRGRTWSWTTNATLEGGFWAGDLSNGDCGFINTRGPPHENWMKGNCKDLNYFICHLQF